MRTRTRKPSTRIRRRPALAGLGRGAPAALPLGGALGGGALGGGLPGAGMRPPIAPPMAGPPGAGALPGMKKGGKVKKTGPHMLHKGEKVVPAGKGSGPMGKGKRPSARKR